MKPVYSYRFGKFDTEGFITDWQNYETYINTAKDIQKVLESGYDYQVLKSIKETVEKVMSYYDEFESDENIDIQVGSIVLRKNLAWLRDDVKDAMAYYTMEGTGWLGSAYYKDKGFLNKCMTKINTKLRDIANGVAYGDPTHRHIYHILEPERDYVIYNGREFYKWDGWHSSRKVMEEMADKQFNA